MNKYIINIIKNIFSKELPKPIGRWSIEHSTTQIHHKIDLSNEDHCGPCGQYAKNQINKKENKDNNEKKDFYLEKSK